MRIIMIQKGTGLIVSTQEPNQQNVKALLQELGLTPKISLNLSFLIDDVEEFNSFKSRYWKGKSRQANALAGYHRERVKQRKLSCSDCIQLFEGGQTGDYPEKKFLEELFLQPINDYEASVTITEIKNDVELLPKLYEFSTSNVGVNVRSAMICLLGDVFA